VLAQINLDSNPNKCNKFNSFWWSLAEVGVKKFDKRRRFKMNEGDSHGMFDGGEEMSSIY